MSDSVETAFNDFVNAINAHDVNAMAALMTDDHTFTDALNNAVTGKDALQTSWKFYFDWFPDYTIEIDEAISFGDGVAAFGYASGTFRGIRTSDNFNHWRLPLAVKAEIAGGKVKVWQVYIDTKVPFEIIASNQSH